MNIKLARWVSYDHLPQNTAQQTSRLGATLEL